MNNFYKTGNFISEIRKARGLSQEELGKKLHVTKKAVSRWETGRGLPDAAILLSLAQILEVSVDEILKGELAITSEIDNESKKKIERMNAFFEYLLEKKLLQKTIVLYVPLTLATVFGAIKVYKANTSLDFFSDSSLYTSHIFTVVFFIFLIATIIFIYRLIRTIHTRHKIK